MQKNNELIACGAQPHTDELQTSSKHSTNYQDKR